MIAQSVRIVDRNKLVQFRHKRAAGTEQACSVLLDWGIILDHLALPAIMARALGPQTNSASTELPTLDEP